MKKIHAIAVQENYKDILSNLSTDIDQETLLLYLQGKLSGERKHQVEKILNEDKFHDDAMEGLQGIKDKDQLLFMVEMLNRDLKKKTRQKKIRREKRRIPYQPWIYISILILLLLIIICYIVIRKYLQPHS